MLDRCEALRFGTNDGEGRVIILGDEKSAFGWFEIDVFVCAWAWSLFEGELGFYEINWFGTSSEAKVSVLFLVIFVLDK